MTQVDFKEIYKKLKAKVSMQDIEAHDMAFNCINRVVALDSEEKIVQAISEQRVSRACYIYKELPQRLKNLAFNFLNNPKSFGFFSDINSHDALMAFIRKLQSEGVSPSEYIFEGILTYRPLQRGDKKNHLPSLDCEVRYYKGVA